MILTPFPGTPLFNRLEKEERILTRDWSKYDHRHVVFKPKHMSAQELFDNTKKLFEEFYSISNTSKRIVKSMKLGCYPFLSVIFQNFTLATTELHLEGV